MFEDLICSTDEQAALTAIVKLLYDAVILDAPLYRGVVAGLLVEAARVLERPAISWIEVKHARRADLDVDDFMRRVDAALETRRRRTVREFP